MLSSILKIGPTVSRLVNQDRMEINLGFKLSCQNRPEIGKTDNSNQLKNRFNQILNIVSLILIYKW